METALIITASIIIGAAVGAGVIWFLFRSSQSKSGDGEDRSIIMLQNQVNHLTEVIDAKISGMQKEFGISQKNIQEGLHTQLTESQKLMSTINKQVTDQLISVAKGISEVGESSKQIFSVGEQLQNLEKVLKHQKQRGNWGEASLKLALENFLPPDAYTLQYRFKNGETVDAAIHSKEGIIPVDAKFSLDNYQRLINEEDEDKKKALEREFKADLKKRIEETAKYIKPKEGTLPFAIMFIPAEGIYYDLLVNEVGVVNSRELIDFAYRDKKVVIASPTTFLAYLSTILHGYNAFKIEKSAQIIQKNVHNLSKHLQTYDKYFKSVGKSLGATVNHYNQAEKQLNMVDKDIMRITGESVKFEKLDLERPKLEEDQ